VPLKLVHTSQVVAEHDLFRQRGLVNDLIALRLQQCHRDHFIFPQMVGGNVVGNAVHKGTGIVDRLAATAVDQSQVGIVQQIIGGIGTSDPAQQMPKQFLAVLFNQCCRIVWRKSKHSIGT
jgi:hypothetical protein